MNSTFTHIDNLSFVESTFTSNARDSMALVLNDVMTGFMSNCSFLGTGVSVLGQSFVMVNSTTISDSRLKLNPAALVVYSSTVHFTGLTRFLNGNRSLFTYNATVLFSDSTSFHNCTSLDSSLLSVPFAEKGGAITSYLSRLLFQGMATFTNNSAKYGGALFAVESSIVLESNAGEATSPDVTLASISITSNTATSDGGGAYLYRSTLSIAGECFLTGNSAFEKGGGVHAVYSDVNLEPPINDNEYSLVLTGNSARFGGGIHLEGASRLRMFISNSSIQFHNNRANYGAAIYVDDNTIYRTCLSSQSYGTIAVSECFFQVLNPLNSTQSMLDINVNSMIFSNNVADTSGTNLFGGLLDRCVPTIPPTTAHFDFQTGNSDCKTFDGLAYFKSITNLNALNSSGIASYPTRMCTCEGDKPNCSTRSISVKNVQNGEPFNLSVTAVDQTNHPTKSIIVAYLLSSKGSVDKQGGIDDVGVCTNLTLSVNSPNEYEVLNLYADGPCKDTEPSRLAVSLAFAPCVCPIGFALVETNDKISGCECTCDPLIADFVDNCNDTLITRRDNSWIMHETNSKTNETLYTIGPNCPFSFCGGNRKVDLSSSNTDTQCIEDRSGTLCIECSENRSLALSGKRCIHCPTFWPLLTIATLIGAFLIGIGLVVAIMALNFTVSVGTINGFIFYVNILDVSDMIFLPFGSFSFPELIIEWLNLDPGLDICFVPGYFLYPHVWIRLSFPLYIILIVVAIILISGRSLRFSQFIGKRNPIAVLATLILLSYGNFLQTSLIILSPSLLVHVSANETRREVVWLLDGHLPYFTGIHIPLCIVAIAILLLAIAYKVLIFSWQWMIRCPNRPMLRWINNQKLNAFIQTYQAPYHDKHRYWTGLLLLVRVLLTIVLISTGSTNPDDSVLL